MSDTSSDISLADFLETCQTGDILLYNSQYWYSRLIEWGSGSKFSHISIILRDPTFINKKLNGLYILESSYEDIPDSNTGEKVWGVQIIPLQHVIDEYQKSYVGNLYYRRLETEKDESFYNKLKECVTHTEGDKYDLNPLDWFKAEFQLDVGNTRKENTFWCSALVGYVYCQLGFIDQDISWSILPPRKFSHFENDRLTYYNCILAPEKLIKLS